MTHSDFIDSILRNFDHEPQTCRVIDSDSQNVTKAFFKNEVLNSKSPVLLREGIRQNLLEKWSPPKLVGHLKSQDGILWVIRGSAEQGGTNLVEITVKEYLDYLADQDKR